jgi:hypothetical protein
MQKFTSIESFKQVIQHTRKYFGKTGLPLPTRTFEGTVKLHGTNAGIRRTADGRIIPQSREHSISVGSDNAGFAFFVETHKDAIKALFDRYPIVEGQELTLFGEWCGGNIQKTVALNEVPKHLVLFAAKYSSINPVFDENETDDDCYPRYCELLRDLHDNENGIYNIYQIPTYEVTVDFLNPEAASFELAALTLAVEKEDPWVKLMFGKSGLGEGIVWRRKDEPSQSRNWFKTKGLMHKNAGDNSKTAKIRIDDDKLASIKELVSIILPEWRLEQGISALKESGIPLLPQGTGDYLKWICSDIYKEELDTIAASGFEWKQVQGQVTQTARNYYLTEIQEEFS